MECTQNASTTCLNSCGAPGTRSCSATCTWLGQCAGPEVCNYCDDNLNGTIEDESAVAFYESAHTGLRRCATSVTGSASSGSCATGAFDDDQTIVAGTTTNDRAAVWSSEPIRVGYDTLVIDAGMIAEDLGVNPGAGWALIVTDQAPTPLLYGAAGDNLGVPTVDGFSQVRAEWRYYQPGQSSSAESSSDRVTAWEHFESCFGFLCDWIDVEVGARNGATPALGGPTSQAVQGLRIEYTPPVLFRPGVVRVYVRQLFVADLLVAEFVPRNDWQPGTELYVGVTAATASNGRNRFIANGGGMNVVARGHCYEDDTLQVAGGGDSGRLEVFHGGQWGTVCHDPGGASGWDSANVNASVACGELGYGGGSAVGASSTPDGTGPVWLDDVVCAGSEASLTDCSSSIYGATNCTHSEDVGVSCTP